MNAFAHFSLAPIEVIGDNPALSHSGGTRVNNPKRAARGAIGVKLSVPARA